MKVTNSILSKKKKKDIEQYILYTKLKNRWN